MQVTVAESRHIPEQCVIASHPTLSTGAQMDPHQRCHEWFVRSGPAFIPRARLPISIVYGLLWFFSLFCSLSLHAHEGHAPLPSKGVQVDVVKGLITLSPEAQKSLGLQTAAVQQKTLDEQALAYATLVTPWQRQHFVASLLPGRIAAIHVVTGQMVKAGDLLAEIDGPELESLRLELLNAVNELDLSKRRAEQLSTLAKDQVVAGREYLEAESKKEHDFNAVHIARSKLRSLGLTDATIDRAIQLNGGEGALMLPLYCPIQGTVSHADLSVGKVIAANEHLFEVNDLSELWIKIGVLERDVGRIKRGQRVTVEFTAFPGKSVESIISLPAVEGDSATHLATVWADLANPSHGPQYVPGMYGTARIITSEPTQLLTVPATALLGNGAERYVLVEVAATKKGFEYRKQNVVIAAQTSAQVQVRTGGLYPGDQVVTVGGQVLSSFFILGSLRLSKEGIRNVGLHVEPAAKRIVEDVISLQGLVDLPPGHVATVSSQFSGSLNRIHVDRGERVQPGQVIAEVTSLQIQDIQLSLLRYALEAKLLGGTIERLKSVGQVPLVAGRRLWEMESARDVAVNRRDSARQTLMTMGLSATAIDDVVKTGEPRATIPIRAPIEGVVVRLNKVLGEGVTADEALLEIHDGTQPWVKAFLAEKDVVKVGIGTSARVRLLSDPAFIAEARVVQSARSFGIDTRTLEVWLKFTTPPQQTLQRNLLADVTVIVGHSDATLALPLSAIVREQTRSYVFVQKWGGLLERRSVELGRSDDRYVEITAGLNEGERVAVQGTAELQTTYASIR